MTLLWDVWVWSLLIRERFKLILDLYLFDLRENDLSCFIELERDLDKTHDWDQIFAEKQIIFNGLIMDRLRVWRHFIDFFNKVYQ